MQLQPRNSLTALDFVSSTEEKQKEIMGLFKASSLGFCLFLLLAVDAVKSQAAGDDPAYPFVRDATRAPLIETYDYIIVGGGTAGCPLAATLSQQFKVLVLERGSSPYGNVNISRIENFQIGLNDTVGDSTPVQPFTSTDGVLNSRARVLGGASAINAGFYTRANASFIRDALLDPVMVNASYSWVEDRIVFLPQLVPFQSSLRRSFVEAGFRDFGTTFEDVVGVKTGALTYDRQGKRYTAADLLKESNDENLLVVLRAEVQRILIDKQGGQTPRAYGVNYTDPRGRVHVAVLNPAEGSQVILAAGTIASPQLLLLSGIGPSKQLRALGIDVILDSPDVGKYLNDNPRNIISIPSPIPVNEALGQVMALTALGSYLDASSSASSQTGTLLEKINGPISLGELSLNTLNISDNPIITFNYFNDTRDLEKCIDGIDRLERIMLSAPSFKPFRFENQTLPSGGTVASPTRRTSSRSATRNALGSFCRLNLVTIGHYHGGCRVGKVVDEGYNVIGVDGIRVVDSSTFKDSPGATPQATVLMLGRYMGLKIINERCSPVLLQQPQRATASASACKAIQNGAARDE